MMARRARGRRTAAASAGQPGVKPGQTLGQALDAVQDLVAARPEDLRHIGIRRGVEAEAEGLHA